MLNYLYLNQDRTRKVSTWKTPDVRPWLAGIDKLMYMHNLILPRRLV